MSKEYGWFEALDTEIHEQGIVAMMLLIEARKTARLFATGADDPDAAAVALFPNVLNTLTGLVTANVSIDAVKERHKQNEALHNSKALVEQMQSEWQREQDQRAQSREQMLRTWEER